MIKYRKEKIETRIIDSVVCEVCKKEYKYDSDFLEAQEFQKLTVNGGYASVFGDGVRMKADICQHCFKELFGKYLVKEDENEVL